MKKLLICIGSALLGAFFILSAWYKLFPIEPFEYKIVGSTFISWLPSVFVARLVIAIEFGIGALLLFSYALKKTLPIAIVALMVFSLHLIAVLILQGNIADCGCMGSLISMTPLEGLLKNLGLIVLAIVLYKYAFTFELKVQHLLYYVFLISTTAVFIVNPVDLTYSEKYLNKPFEGFDLDLDTLYEMQATEKVDKPAADIRGTKTLLAFVSAKCPHCKIAAQKIAVIHRKNPEIPFYMFINGDVSAIDSFIHSTETKDIPHSKLNGPLFIQMAGLNLPVLYYYDKGRVVKQVDYYTLEQYHIEEWLKRSGRE